MPHAPEPASRREFLRTTATGVVGALLVPELVGADDALPSAASAPSRVVVVQDRNVLDATAIRDSSINREVIQLMMDAGIRGLTGIRDVGQAWSSLFPALTQTTVIGIKVNSLYWLNFTHPRVTRAVVDGLTSMTVEGKPFPANNIVVWDRKDSHLERNGYAINRGETGVRCFGTNDGYTADKVAVVDGKPPQGISRILAEQCDYLINLSVLKNHGLAGVTLSLKNHYGTVEVPSDLHTPYCDPAISVINALPLIRRKQVVSICDAVFGSTVDADKPPTVRPRSLIFSRDPVALDATGARMLASHGAGTTGLDGLARHIATSGQPPYELGTFDFRRIESITISDPSSRRRAAHGG